MTVFHDNIWRVNDKYWLSLREFGSTNEDHNVHEESNVVDVEVDSKLEVLGAESVLVTPSHHQLRVVDNVETEDDAANASVDQPESPAGGEEGGNQTEDDEADQHSQESTWARSLQEIQGQRDCYLQWQWSQF